MNSPEIDICLLKIARIENDFGVDRLKTALKRGNEYMLPEKYRWLKSHLEAEFRSFHAKQKQELTGDPEFKNFSGTDFEVYLAKVLKENGFEDVRGTSTTGDQGADLIVKKGNRKIVIQAKCWHALRNKQLT